MKTLVYNCAALTNFDRFEFAVIWEKAECPLMGAVPIQAKDFFPKIPLVSTVKQHPSKGFFVRAVCKYGRDNQPNDTSVSAARTSAGGDGGRISEPAREQFSLFGQTILQRAGKLRKSGIAVSEGWLRMDTRLKDKRNLLAQGWDSFAFAQDSPHGHS